MAFEIQNFEYEAIVQTTFYREFNVTEHFEALSSQSNILFEAIGEGIICILDLRELDMDVPETVEGLLKATRRGIGFLHHHHIEAVYIVSNNAVMDMVGRALGSPRYGELTSIIVRTPEEAFADIRESTSEPAPNYAMFARQMVIG